jgi:sensor histidine kinase YesM
MQKPTGKPSGIGLANTKARIEELYGNSARLVLNSKSGEGFSVQIEIPFRSQAG